MEITTLDELQATTRAVVTRAEVARLLEVDERTVSRAIEAGDLPSVRAGKRVLIPVRRLVWLLAGAHPEADAINAEIAEMCAGLSDDEMSGRVYDETLFDPLPPAPVPRRKRRYRINRPILEETARVYLQARDSNAPPTIAVEEHFDVSRSTAGVQIRKARDEGLIPPTKQGAR